MCVLERAWTISCCTIFGILFSVVFSLSIWGVSMYYPNCNDACKWIPMTSICVFVWCVVWSCLKFEYPNDFVLCLSYHRNVKVTVERVLYILEMPCIPCCILWKFQTRFCSWIWHIINTKKDNDIRVGTENGCGKNDSKDLNDLAIASSIPVNVQANVPVNVPVTHLPVNVPLSVQRNVPTTHVPMNVPMNVPINVPIIVHVVEDPIQNLQNNL